MFTLRSHSLLVGLVILVALASPAFAFGAGNIASISKVEGQNWRHGDITDALLILSQAQALNGKKFNKINVSRVYFGNWLRDYSQAIDVGTVKSVSAEAIRLLLCVLGFMTFGYGSGEFEVTAERLGCYRPEDHIDNPKDYAENVDARQYDERLRGPIDEERELSVDPETGMKNYIANERARCMTSARHIKKLFTGTIELARRYKDSRRKADKYEALRLMGTGLHCLEDFFAHSNYCELALIELGERDTFAHVGRDTEMEIEGARGPVYPVVTGTFGGVDFLHSVTGEVSDKLTQNEIEELEGTLQQGAKTDTSMLRDLLDKIPDGIFGDKHQSDRVDELQNNAAAAQMENTSVSPRDPEEFTQYIQNVFKQVMPAIEFHDDIMKSISGAMERIPVLPKIIEQLEEQLSVFIFSIIAPFIVPLIQQIRNELKTGSEEIIASSEREQHIVFNNDRSTDPTHSMLSKDHFSNILNEIAGRNAASMVQWVVPQLMDAIDDESTDVDRLLDDIVNGVLHHPAQRDLGSRKAQEGRHRFFAGVEEWWREMGDGQREDYRRKLTRDGVQNGENHKEGVHDTGHGHGCAGKLKMRKLYGGGPETLEDKIAGAAADAIFKGATGALSGLVEQNTGYKMPSSSHKEEKEEGGLSGFLNQASSLLGGAFNDDETKRQSSSRREDDGSYTKTETEYGHHGNRYGQAEYSQTQRPDGSQHEEYRRYEQRDSSDGRHTGGYGYEERTETHQTYSGGYEQRTERQEYYGSNEESHGRRRDDNDGGYGGRRHEESSYGGSSGYGRQEESSYGRQEQSSYGGGYGGHQEESSYGRQEQSSYGGGYGGSSGGYGRQEESSYGRQEQSGYGGGSGYERREEGGYGGDSYGRRDDNGYGGGSADDYVRQSSGGHNRERRGSRGSRDNDQYGDNGYGGDRRW
ncbi:het-c protein [Fusarium flagelliforme]|uniref:Het-c protein n=1 Tax=Fusarium flagelliforme TaxID=2675880 RepID=A0A395MHG5_9HYPO|nr:het-c protein [Fusarium flagelliforme]